MSYERDGDSHLKGVGTIAATAGSRPRSDLRRRQRQALITRARDRAMSGVTYGPRGGLYGGMGLGAINTSFASMKARIPMTSVPVDGGQGVMGAGGTANPTLSGGGIQGGGGVISGASLPSRVAFSPAQLMIPVVSSSPVVTGPGRTSVITTDPTTGTTTTTTTTTDPTATSTTDPSSSTTVATSGGAGGGVSTTSDGSIPTLDTTDTTVSDPGLIDGMSTNMKIALGLGAAAAFYLLFMRKKDGD